MSVVGSSVGGSVGGILQFIWKEFEIMCLLWVARLVGQWVLFCSLSGRSLRSCVCCGWVFGWVDGWVLQCIWKEFEIMCLLWVARWVGQWVGFCSLSGRSLR